MGNPERSQLLTNALRATASRAVELSQGGSALLFAKMPGEVDDGPPRLRAAAGFASTDEARQAAVELAGAIGQVMQTRQVRNVETVQTLAPRCAGGLRMLPLSIEGQCHGVLVVGSPVTLPEAVCEALDVLTMSTATQLDYERVVAENENLRSNSNGGPAHGGEDQSDELLKLSETLFAQDIELLRSHEKLGQIEKVKSDFIEKMSRELRTPLNSIIESTISVLAGENENLSEGAKQSLRQALDEGTVYQRTLQNILDLWRIKQNEMAVEIQDLNFTEVVDEAIFSIQDTLDGKPITIEKRIPESFPKVKSDLAKVNQILFFLLDNAAKFTTEGEITISAQYENEVLRCQIEDTGIGICPDDQEYIYDEFFQVDDQMSTRYRGAGLGLSLVVELLALLEGTCTITSEAGRGTIATIEIPMQSA